MSTYCHKDIVHIKRYLIIIATLAGRNYYYHFHLQMRKWDFGELRNALRLYPNKCYHCYSNVCCLVVSGNQVLSLDCEERIPKTQAWRSWCGKTVICVGGCLCAPFLSILPWKKSNLAFSEAKTKASVQSFCFTLKLSLLEPTQSATGSYKC